jgi:hypothetical protein
MLFHWILSRCILAPNRRARAFGKRGLVDFTYHLESYSEQHHLTVGVDLSDGMNMSEAVQVADALFDNCMGSHPHKVVSANMNGQGIWTVQLAWDGGHWFRATIDPINKIIVYNHCR